MNNEGKEEITEEDEVLLCNRRRVKFKSDVDNVNADFSQTPKAHCIVNGDGRDVQEHQSKEYTDGCDEKMGDADRKESSGELVGILRPRSISLSPLPLSTLLPATPRFELSNVSKAMRRSNETRGLIEKMKKQMFHLEHEQIEPQPSLVLSSCSHPRERAKSGESENSALVRQKRRMVCIESTKNMMDQTLPPTMMPFVEEALGTAHFLRRRRKESGHGRIIHQILIEQHKRVLKTLEHNENRNGESSQPSKEQSHKSESS